jgi:hypothetical protein
MDVDGGFSHRLVTLPEKLSGAQESPAHQLLDVLRRDGM